MPHKGPLSTANLNATSERKTQFQLHRHAVLIYRVELRRFFASGPHYVTGADIRMAPLPLRLA